MTLDELYASLPAIECKGLCARSCGPVMCEPSEALRAGGKYKLLTLNGRTVAAYEVDRKLRCNLLRNGRCTAYDNRPTICRLWGIVETMPCLWGCQPERMLTDAEGREILRLAETAA